MTTLLRSIGPALLACAALSFPAHADSKRWIHGSWVKVRAAATADGAVVDHLVTNMPVTLLAENGKLCEIGWNRDGSEGRGFVPCRLLGNRALALAEVANETLPDGKPNPQYAPARAFWIAPSMDALFHAGMYFARTLLSPAQFALEQGETEERPQAPPRLVRYPVAEFDAMKAAMGKGVVAPADRDPPLLTCAQFLAARAARAAARNDGDTLRHREWIYPNARNYPHTEPMVSDCGVPELPGLRLPTVRPSLFKSAAELLPGSAGTERISAHFGIVERGAAVAGPKWESDGEIMRYTGAWDIGKYQLSLDKPVVEHVIGRTGLMGAYQWTPQVRETPFKALNSCAEGLRNQRSGKQVLPGYPAVKDALIWFQAPAALPFKKAAIKTRIEQGSRAKSGFADTVKRVAIYEVDLDGDGVPDFVQWDMWGKPEISGPDPLLVRREVFVNINGEWYPFDSDSYRECT